MHKIKVERIIRTIEIADDWTTAPNLAKELKCPRGQLYSILKDMVEMGVLEKEKMSGGRLENTYHYRAKCKIVWLDEEMEESE